MGMNCAFLCHSGVLRFCLNPLGLLCNRKIPQNVSSSCSLTSVIHYWLLKGCAQNMAPGAGASWLKWKTDATAASKHSQRVLLHGLQGQQAVCGGVLCLNSCSWWLQPTKTGLTLASQGQAGSPSVPVSLSHGRGQNGHQPPPSLSYPAVPYRESDSTSALQASSLMLVARQEMPVWLLRLKLSSGCLKRSWITCSGLLPCYVTVRKSLLPCKGPPSLLLIPVVL